MSRAVSVLHGASMARLYLEAAALYAIFEIGCGWANRHLAPRVPAAIPRDLLGDGLALAAAISLVVLFKGLPARWFGLPERAGGWHSAAGGVSRALLLLGILAAAVRILDPGLDAREFASRGLGSTRVLWRFLITLPIGVAAEEILFRSVQERLRSAVGQGWAALSVALCFSLYHLTGSLALKAGAVLPLLATFCGGWLLARLYEITASVGLLISVHVAYDYLAVAQGWLNVEQRRLPELLLFGGWLLGSGLAAFVLRSTRRELGPRDQGGPEKAAAGAARALLPLERRSVRFAASLLFGVGLPLLVKWIRWSL